MKVLQVIQKSQLRGAEIFASQLSSNLQLLGHEVKIVCLFEGKQQLPFDGPIVQLARPVSKRFFDVKGWRMLADIVAEFKPDIVQANAGDTLKMTVLSKLFYRWTSPVVFRNASMIGLYIKSPFVRWLNALLFRKVSYVASVTAASMQNFLELFPFMKDRISVVPIGIDCSHPVEQTHASQAYMLHVGGFSFEKNHARLLYLFERIRQLRPSIELWLVGDGPLKMTIEQQAEQMNLGGVRFLGYRNDVKSLMKDASVLVLPSIIEGLPAVILEGMFCEVPVVAYDVGGISEVVRSGETGWLIRAGDEEAFVNTVVQVINESNEKTIANAREMVLRDFDNLQVARKFVDIYTRI